jgi:hypothetical protein
MNGIFSMETLKVFSGHSNIRRFEADCVIFDKPAQADPCCSDTSGKMGRRILFVYGLEPDVTARELAYEFERYLCL